MDPLYGLLMQVGQLFRLFHNPHKITLEEVDALQNLLQRYPYFQAVYALLAKAAYNQNPSSAGQAVQIAAVYATDRTYLKALLEGTPPFADPKAILTTLVPKEENEAPKTEEYDSGNSYINTIRRKSQREITKQKSLAQLDSIQAFLQKDVAFKPKSLQEMPHEGAQVDLTQKSTTFHDGLATENLAQVLWQQGKLQRALTIYEKLVLKFPEKKAYFVTLIEALKRQI
jgi:tetratricopeptide (TPR) repeat protein